MEKEFIPYEQALALKELGFKENCISIWKDQNTIKTTGDWNNFNMVLYLSAPLYQQVFKWFREKYNLGGYMFPKRVNKETKWKYQTLFFEEVSANHLPMQLEPSKCFKTYEEAELECLRKLIEIVKN